LKAVALHLVAFIRAAVADEGIRGVAVGVELQGLI
jgi:hypothetical protein